MPTEFTNTIRKAGGVSSLSLEIFGLTKRFGSNTILDNLCLSVTEGELLVILGESGSGKSTLIKLIAGLEKPNEGSIRIAGVNQLRIAPHRRDIAVVFQDGNGYDHLSVGRNLELAAKGSNSQNQVAGWVKRLKLDAILSQLLNQLSGGESQRVAVARAMLSGKSVVLLDEPLSHLNQSLREDIRDLILTAHRESGKTFVYVTHDSDEAFYLADRIAVLAAGKIQQAGTTRTIFCSPDSKTVAQLLGQPTIDIVKIPRSWLGAVQGADPSELECGVRSSDWAVTSISIQSQTDAESGQNGLAMKNEYLVIKGPIANCRWMGARWLIEVDCGTKIRIACVSPCDEQMESVLIRAEEWSRKGDGPKPIAVVEATLPRSRVQTFGA